MSFVDRLVGLLNGWSSYGGRREVQVIYESYTVME